MSKEIMELLIKKEIMQDVNILFWASCLFCLSNCSFQDNNNESFKLEVHSSYDKNTYLNIGVFEYENKKKRIPAIIQLNGLILNHSKLADTTFQVLQNDYFIKVGAISKKWTKVQKFNAMKGDSISIKIYLKKDLSPLE